MAAGTLCVSVVILHLHHKGEDASPVSSVSPHVAHDNDSHTVSGLVAEGINRLQINDHVIEVLQSILQEVKISFKQSQVDKWKRVAQKVDRILFYVFLCFQILATVVLMAIIGMGEH